MEERMPGEAMIARRSARRDPTASSGRDGEADVPSRTGTPTIAAASPAATRASACRRLVRAATSKDALAIIDQAVVSGTRFVTAVIVGRVCGPHELGDYTLGFTLYCLGACIQTGLIGFPFTVYCHHLQDDDRRSYAGSVLAHFLAFDAAVMVLLGLAAGALAAGGWRPDLAPFVAVLAVSFPAAFVVEFTRRVQLMAISG